MKKVLAALLFGLLALDASSALAITTTATIDSRVTKVLVDSPSRYGVTLQTASGQGARCADNEDLSGAFTVTNTLLPLPTDPAGSLWCSATGTSATVTITYSMAPLTPYVVKADCSSGAVIFAPGQLKGAHRVVFVNEAATLTQICPVPSASACTDPLGTILPAAIGATFELRYPDAQSSWSCLTGGSANISITVE